MKFASFRIPRGEKIFSHFVPVSSWQITQLWYFWYAIFLGWFCIIIESREKPNPLHHRPSSSKSNGRILKQTIAVCERLFSSKRPLSGQDLAFPRNIFRRFNNRSFSLLFALWQLVIHHQRLFIAINCNRCSFSDVRRLIKRLFLL